MREGLERGRNGIVRHRSEKIEVYRKRVGIPNSATPEITGGDGKRTNTRREEVKDVVQNVLPHHCC